MPYNVIWCISSFHASFLRKYQLVRIFNASSGRCWKLCVRNFPFSIEPSSNPLLDMTTRVVWEVVSLEKKNKFFGKLPLSVFSIVCFLVDRLDQTMYQLFNPSEKYVFSRFAKWTSMAGMTAALDSDFCPASNILHFWKQKPPTRSNLAHMVNGVAVCSPGWPICPQQGQGCDAVRFHLGRALFRKMGPFSCNSASNHLSNLACTAVW